jgi:S-adenosyl-L-methionine hydrolase (adenosine-forming)
VRRAVRSAHRFRESRAAGRDTLGRVGAIITLLTDFGLADPYVGMMKGAALSVNPSATLVDLTHEVPPQDVATGAFLLAHAAGYFPPGTIHVAVVDPGVGSRRRPIAVAADDQVFVGPDNGLLSLALRSRRRRRAVVLRDVRYFWRERSHTFHGRDLFAPVAAHLSLGVALGELGPPAGRLVSLPWPRPRTRGRRIHGAILLVDRYGNLITNIDHRQLGARVMIVAGQHRWRRIVDAYADAAPGEPLALVDSYGLLELAVRDGSAAERLGLRRGDPVTVERR